MARKDRHRINEAIRSLEVRLINSKNENEGVVSTEEALKKAQAVRLDLIEISPHAKPPVAKIMDYGKFKYEQSKRESQQRARQQSTETKVVQVKIGTGEHDLDLKAKRIQKWLEEGHRVKIELYLRGRSKYMEKSFLEERLNRILKLVTIEHKIATPPAKGPKGMYMIVEKNS